MGGILADRRRLAGVVTLIVGGAMLAIVLPQIGLLLAPAVALFAALLLGFMPGERLIERMRVRRRTRRPRRAPRTLQVRVVVVFRRRISLASSALAMRPPPAAPVSIS